MATNSPRTGPGARTKPSSSATRTANACFMAPMTAVLRPAPQSATDHFRTETRAARLQGRAAHFIRSGFRAIGFRGGEQIRRSKGKMSCVVSQRPGQHQFSSHPHAQHGRQCRHGAAIGFSAAGRGRAWHGGQLAALCQPGRRGCSEGGRQRHRRGGGRRLCAGRHASLLRQYRRRRIHHHASRQGKDTFIDFREKAPGGRHREDVSGRQGQRRSQPQPVRYKASACRVPSWASRRCWTNTAP